VKKEGSDKWSWSYLVHFIGWNDRHNDWIDEINIYKATPANKKWAEDIQEEVERRRKRDSQSKLSSRTSSPATAPSLSTTDDSRKRERATEDAASNSKQKRRRKANLPEEGDVKDAPHGPEYPSHKCIVDGCDRYKQRQCNRMCCTHYRESLREKETVGDEDSVASDDSDDGWSCPICDKQHGPDTLTCSGACNGVRRCLSLGCTKACEKDCDGMCRSHYQEALGASEAIDSEDDGGNNDVAVKGDGAAATLSASALEFTTQASANTTEIAGDVAKEESGAEAATTAAAAEMAQSDVAKTSADQGPRDDSNTACDEDSADTRNNENFTGDGKMAAAGDLDSEGAAAVAVASTGSVGSLDETGEPNDEVGISFPQSAAAAAAASTPLRRAVQKPSLQDTMDALTEADGDGDDNDDGRDFEDVFGYFGAGL
jgi:hypothetical protein